MYRRVGQLVHLPRELGEPHRPRLAVQYAGRMRSSSATSFVAAASRAS